MDDGVLQARGHQVLLCLHFKQDSAVAHGVESGPSVPPIDEIKITWSCQRPWPRRSARAGRSSPRARAPDLPRNRRGLTPSYELAYPKSELTTSLSMLLVKRTRWEAFSKHSTRGPSRNTPRPRRLLGRRRGRRPSASPWTPPSEPRGVRRRNFPAASARRSGPSSARSRHNDLHTCRLRSPSVRRRGCLALSQALPCFTCPDW